MLVPTISSLVRSLLSPGIAKSRAGQPDRVVPWSRVIPTAAAVAFTGNNTAAQADLLAQPLTGSAFQTIAVGATATYQFDKPATETDTLVVWELTGGLPSEWTIFIDKWNGSTWDRVATWTPWFTVPTGIYMRRADIFKLEAVTHDAAGRYRLSFTNNSASVYSSRTPHLYAWPKAGVPPLVHIVGASIMDGDTTWSRWIAQCQPLGIDVVCINFGASGMECQGIGDNVARWHASSWRPAMQWVIQHAGGNNVSPTRPWSGLSPAQIADIQGRLDYLMAQYPNPSLCYPACITFRDYVPPNPVMDGVYEERGSLPYNVNIWIPTIASDFPHAMNSDGRPIMDFYNIVFNNEEEWLGDGIHMNGTGAAAFDNWICDRWIRVVRRLPTPEVVLTNPYRPATALVAACEASPNQTTFTTAHDAVQALTAQDGNGKAELLTRLAVTGFPVCTTAPGIIGVAVLGSTLYDGAGTWSNGPTAYSYAWLRDGVVIPGANSDAYVVTADDIGKTLQRRVIATNALGTGTAYSSTVIAAGAYNPNEIGDVRLWLDASDSSTFSFSSGAVVSQWRDKSGNGHHASQATVTRQPTRRTAPGDGLYEVVADNVDDGMSIAMPPMPARTAPGDLFILTGDAPDIGFGGYIASATPDGVSARHNYVFTWEDGTNPFLNVTVGGNNIGIRQSEITAAGFTVDYTKPLLFQSATPVGNTATIRVNNGYSKNGTITVADTSANVWTLFCRPPIAGNPSAGPIRQAIIFNKVLSDLERTRLWNWLRLNHIAPLPVNTVAPSFTGTVSNGFTLTGSDGTWTGASSYDRQWLRDGVPIFGASSNTYTVTAADNGKTISYRVIGVNASGATSAFSAGSYVTPSLAPNEIANLKLWLDATDASTFTYGTAPAVAQWRDKSGNGYHAVQATASAQPTRRQSPTDNEWEVLADGVNDSFSIPGMPTILRNSACDVVLLAGANADQTGALLGCVSADGSIRNCYFYNWEDGTNPFLNVNFAGAVNSRTLASIIAAYPTFDRFKPIAYHYGYTTSGMGATCRLNDTYDTGALSVGPADMTGAIWTLFCRSPAPAFPGGGPLRQVIIYDRRLSTAERAALHQWLRLHGNMP